MASNVQKIAQLGNPDFQNVMPLNRGQFNQILKEENLKDFSLLFYDTRLGADLYLEMKELSAHHVEPLTVILTTTENADLKDFLRLSYCPDGVLYEPIINRDLEFVLKQFKFEAQKKNKIDPVKCFRLRSQGEIISIPFLDIIFFESFGKQVALRTQGQEFLFYSNLGTIMAQLDDSFVRCHKGYVINTNYIKGICLSKLQIKVLDQSIIPFSRTYKKALEPWFRKDKHDDHRNSLYFDSR